MKFIILTFLSFYTCLGVLRAQSFKVYNSIQYLNTPDLSKYGMNKIILIYENELLGNVRNPESHKLEKVPDYTKILKAIHYINKNPGVPVCLDIESWKLNNEQSRLKNKYKYKYVLTYFRNHIPYNNVEYYFHTIATDSIIYPSFYTHNKDSLKWKNDVISIISSLRKSYPNAKIIPFIWPQYDPAGKKELAFNFISSSYWRFELETLYKYADGIVIWTQYQANKKNPIYFNKKMPWFQETLKFMKKHNIK